MKRDFLKTICCALCLSGMALTAAAQGIVVNLTNGEKVYYKASEVESVGVYDYGEEPEPDPDEINFTVNGVSFKMVQVKGGTFSMGSSSRDSDEKPVHSVTLSDFAIGETEVTQELWETVMGTNPSNFKGSKKPVETVSWDDCQTFISKLNSLTGSNFRLPTEAEWEFAARGGVNSKGYTYSGSNVIDDVAWYLSNSESTAHDVATKAANELGIYDMSGNVYEWCQDWYSSSYYSSSPISNPTGPSTGSYRVSRGGSRNDFFSYCCLTDRHYDAPSRGNRFLGLRLAL